MFEDTSNHPLTDTASAEGIVDNDVTEPRKINIVGYDATEGYGSVVRCPADNKTERCLKRPCDPLTRPVSCPVCAAEERFHGGDIDARAVRR